MNVYVAGVLGLLGVLCLVAGVHGKGPQLFTALTGSSAPAGASSSGGNTGQGHASPVPTLPGGLPGAMTGPVMTA